MVLSEIKFISSIGTLGPYLMINNIPNKHHKQAKNLMGRDVIVMRSV